MAAVQSRAQVHFC